MSVRPRAVSQRSLAAGLLAAIAAAGCRTARPEPPREVPAVIVGPTAASRAELAAAVRAALHGAPVVLADDALTRTSSLTVERAIPRDAAGLPADGRVLGEPERFRLVKRGAACVLVHEQSGTGAALEGTRCAPGR